MSFSRPIQWYHSHADSIWPDGTFKGLVLYPTHLTFTHSFIPHHLPRPFFLYLHCFSAQQEKLPHGVPTENRTGACLPAFKPPSYAAPIC